MSEQAFRNTENLGKTNSINDGDLAESVKLAASSASTSEGLETSKSWNLDVAQSQSTAEGKTR